MKRNNIRINKEAAFLKHRNVNRRIQKTGFIANILSHSQGKKKINVFLSQQEGMITYTQRW